MSRLLFVALGGALFLYMCEPAAAIVGTKRCTLQAPGDACIFDLHTNAAGTLRVCTKALAASERWRSTVGKTNTAGGSSAVGSGTTACTGAAATSVVANADYEAIVTLDRPKSGGFPRQVDVTIDVPAATIPGPRPIGPPGSGGLPESCATTDGELIDCGQTIACRLDSSVDNDLFKFDAPTAAKPMIRICGASSTRWSLYSPPPVTYLGASFGRAVTAALPKSGRYSIVVSNDVGTVTDYLLTLQGVSPLFRCAPSISPGVTINRHLDSKCDIDTHKFDGNSGETWTIRISGASSTLWELYSPIGAYLGASFGQANVTLPIDGSYTIAVSNDVGTVTDYQLMILKIGG